MAEPGKIAVELSMIMDGFNKALFDAKSKLTGLGKDFDVVAARMQKFADGLGSAGKKLSTFVMLPLLGAGIAAVKTAADMEMLEAQLTTLLGDASKARRMLNEIKELASKTPFGTQDIAEATQTLLGFGVASGEVLDVITMLGDTSQGNAEKLKSVSLAYGQITAQGKASMQDMRQFINAGVPIFQALEKSTGKTTAELMNMTSQGKITSDVITQAFQTMTSEGGIFYKGMETASLTTQGLWSTMIDELKNFGESIGVILIPAVKEIIKEITSWLTAFKELDDETKKTILTVAGIVAGLGPLLILFGKLITAYRAFIVVQAAVSAGLAGQAVATGASTAALIANKVAMVAATAATKLFNLVLQINPIVAITTAVLALAAGFVYLVQKIIVAKDEHLKASNQFIEEQEKMNNALNKMKIEEHTKRWMDLIEKKKQAGMTIKAIRAEMEKLIATNEKRIKQMQEEGKFSAEEINRFKKQLEGMKEASDKLLGTTKTDKRIEAEKKWKAEHEKVQKEILKYNEEAGKNALELEELRYSREIAKLNKHLQERYITQNQYNETAENLTAEHEKKKTEIVQQEEDRRRQLIFGGLSQIGTMVSELGNLFSMYYQNSQTEIDNDTQKKLDAIAEQYDAEKAAIEATITDEAQRDAALKALDEKRAREEKSIQEKADKEKRKLAREAAKRQREIAIFETIIATPQAAYQAFKAMAGIPYVGPALGAIAAAAATALGLAKLALIQSQPLPALAAGGYADTATAAIFGEKGREVALPLDGPEGQNALALLANKLLASIESRLAGTNAGAAVSAGASIVKEKAQNMFHVVVNLGSKVLYDDITEATENGEILIHARAIV